MGKTQNLNRKVMFADLKQVDTLIMQLEYPENTLKIHFGFSSIVACKTNNDRDGNLKNWLLDF